MEIVFLSGPAAGRYGGSSFTIIILIREDDAFEFRSEDAICLLVSPILTTKYRWRSINQGYWSYSMLLL